LIVVFFVNSDNVFKFNRLIGTSCTVFHLVRLLPQRLNATLYLQKHSVLTKDVEDVPPPPDDKTLVIEDGNAAFYYRI
jgi:hypothetical protein